MTSRKRKRTWSTSRPARKKARYSAPKANIYARKAATKELKGMDTSLALPLGGPVPTTTVTNEGCVVVNSIQQGAGSWNRVGRKCYNKSLLIKGEIGLSYSPLAATGAIALPMLRMVVIWDKQPCGFSIPTFETIFARTDQGGTETSKVFDPPRYDNMNRFTVLRDMMITADKAITPAVGTGNNVDVSVPINEYIKLGNKETVYGSFTDPATIANISTGAILVYFRTTTTTAVDAATWLIPETLIARLRYTD